MKTVQLISIIIPVYNCARYISNCIESLISQLEDDIEILIVDDGSNDGTEEICDSYATLDSRITVIHKENKGVSSARNCGLENASGEYVIFIDGDDYVADDFFMEIRKTIEEDDLDLLIWNYSFIKGSNENTNEDFPQTIILDKRKDIKYAMATTLCPLITNLKTPNKRINAMGFLWNKIFKMSTIKKMGLKFNEEVVLYEDVLFVYKYLKYAEKVGFVNKSLYYYRVLQSGATLKYKPNIAYNNDILIRDFENEFECISDIQIEAYYSRIIRLLADVIKYYCFHKDFKGKRFHELKSIIDSQPKYWEAINNVSDDYLTLKQKTIVKIVKIIYSR